MRILHVLFGSALRPEQKFLGTTKDIRGRTQYFHERGIEYEELVLDVRKEKYFRRRALEMGVDRFDVVLVEGTYFPVTMALLKKRYPQVRFLARGINAEFLHWLHSGVAAVQFDTWRRAFADLKGACSYGWKDFRCARTADAILPIADWESRWYWRCFAPRRRIVTVPYFLPEAYLKEIPPAAPRERGCVCMMTTKAGRPFLLDAARNLFRLVDGLEGGEPDWRFSVTGEYPKDRLAPSSRVEIRGFLDNPLEILARSRAVALLSNYGFGFKTKLLEAICCGCYVLVPKKLHGRLPSAVQRYSLVVDVRSVTSFREALARSLEPFPAGDPNTELREQAFQALDRVLGVAAASPRTVAQPADLAAADPVQS